MSDDSYNPGQIEPKWREYWISNHLHEARNDDPRPKYYCLDMFPYPSGSGLHVGHWRSYVLPDCWSRYKRLQGSPPDGLGCFRLTRRERRDTERYSPEGWYSA